MFKHLSPGSRQNSAESQSLGMQIQFTKNSGYIQSLGCQQEKNKKILNRFTKLVLKFKGHRIFEILYNFFVALTYKVCKHWFAIVFVSCFTSMPQK